MTTIWFAVVAASPPKLQVRESVVVFAPGVVGFPRIVTVQVVPDPARSAVPQVSAVTVKFVASVMVGVEHPVADAAPEFVSVKTWVPEFDPTLMLPKFFVNGVHAREAAVPVTVIWFVVVEAAPPKVQVLERVVDLAPTVVGFPWTVTVQVPLVAARSAVPQVSAAIVKFVASVMDGAEHPVADAPPVFDKVKIWVAEFDPMFTPPKA